MLMHSGNPWFQSCAAVVSKNSNVFLDASSLIEGKPTCSRINSLAVKPLKYLYAYLGDAKKIMFGSGWPDSDFKTAVKIYQAAIPRSDWDDVFYNNAARFFGFSEFD
jgi:predicted TIM-barrel fold metal-dependent hydrolase